MYSLEQRGTSNSFKKYWPNVYNERLKEIGLKREYAILVIKSEQLFSRTGMTFSYIIPHVHRCQ